MRYLDQLDSADRQEPSLARTTKTHRLKDRFATLKEEMRRLDKLDARMLATPDRQISLRDPDARSMATSGPGSGMEGGLKSNEHGGPERDRRLTERI